jgi:phytoene dehydrogenase-like protein
VNSRRNASELTSVPREPVRHAAARASVVGSGPSGLAAAITLAQAGTDVHVYEGADIPGGAVRSFELTEPGFTYDFGAAVYPMGLASPFFSGLPLQNHGLEWIHSPVPLAHPLDDGTAVILERNLEQTAANLGTDRTAYEKLLAPLVTDWDSLIEDVLRSPLHVPRPWLLMARFGLRAGEPASFLTKSVFKSPRTKALFGGLAAHSVSKLEAPLSSAFALLFAAAAHAVGWPVPAGGAQKITSALIACLQKLGGRVLTGLRVDALEELDSPDLVLLDVGPRAFARLAARQLTSRSFARSLSRYRYGPGVFKMDWALSEPIPWRAKECLQAATVHVGGRFEEIAESERAAVDGRPPEKPFVLLAQPSLFDPSRAPAGKHTAWAYCHVPNGWVSSAQQQIEDQVERFAPGFRDCALVRHCSGPRELQEADENLVGGDVLGGATSLRQILFRPTWHGYRTSIRRVYLCSASTPPGGGVHGMCGCHAARTALGDFKQSP